MSNKYFIIPIFVPHLGCPHDCVFCNQKRITGLSTDVKPEDVGQIIEDHLSTFPDGDKTIELAFFGGSFTGIDKDIQEELLKVAYSYKKKGLIQGIRLSTRPDYIDCDILDLLKTYGVDTIELGVQSMLSDVLDESGRGHSPGAVYEAADLIKEYRMNLGLQMMVGLVGDTREKSIYTAKELIKLDPYCVRIYPTLVIKDTYLEKLYLKGEYEALSLDRAVDITTDLLMMFEDKNINVIRVGLQPTENIQMGKDVVAGPFHPSFRQLVESNIIKNMIGLNLDKESIRDVDLLTIEARGRDISNISGQKSSNLKYFKDSFNIKKIKLYSNNNLDKNIVLKIGDREIILDVERYRHKYLEENDLI